MKRLILIVCVLSLIFSLTACTDSKEDYKNVSMLENCYYYGESDNFIVTLTSGKKEDPAIIDGACGKLQPYCKLTVAVKSGYSDEYSYQIAMGEELFSGTLKDEIVGGNLRDEFSVSEISELEYKIIITYSGKTQEVNLKSVITDDMIKWNEAKAIAKKELSNSITEMQSEIADNYEVYVKFVYNKEGETGSWYVAYANEEKLLAVLIDPISGDITAKRT